MIKNINIINFFKCGIGRFSAFFLRMEVLAYLNQADGGKGGGVVSKPNIAT